MAESDDIVELLREAAHESCDGPYATFDPDLDHGPLLRWAADEIVELRAENERLQELIDAWVDAFMAWNRTQPYPDELIAGETALVAARTEEENRG